MTDDLVKRLREAAKKRDGFEAVFLSEDAADRIEALERERDAEREMAAMFRNQRIQAEARLAKAVEALRAALEGLNWAKAHLSTRGVESVAVNHADKAVYAVLAEIGEME